jgi:hypothetical protein
MDKKKIRIELLCTQYSAVGTLLKDYKTIAENIASNKFGKALQKTDSRLYTKYAEGVTIFDLTEKQYEKFLQAIGIGPKKCFVIGELRRFVGTQEGEADLSMTRQMDIGVWEEVDAKRIPATYDTEKEARKELKELDDDNAVYPALLDGDTITIYDGYSETPVYVGSIYKLDE